MKRSWVITGLLIILFSCRQRVDYILQSVPGEISPPDSAIYFDTKISGTIPGDSLHILNLENPLLYTKENILNGKTLFERYCKHCHGKSGDSDAPMIKKEKYPPPPKYRDKVPELKDGELFNIIYNGKNLMPPNKNELDENEIWSLVIYVRELSKNGQK